MEYNRARQLVTEFNPCVTNSVHSWKLLHSLTPPHVFTQHATKIFSLQKKINNT